MKNKFLLLVVVSALFVTFFRLNEIPRALYWDEAAFGYYGKSLLKYGTDEYGVRFPFYFKSIGDYKYPLYSYLTVIPAVLFNNEEFIARFISAASGVIIIFFIFLFANKEGWLPKSNIGKLACITLLLSSPWYLVFARTARESTLGVALILIGIWCLYQHFLKPRNFLPIVALLLFSLTSITYPAYRMVTPLLWLSWIILLLVNKKLNDPKRILLYFLILASLVGALTFSKDSRLRAENVFNGVDTKTQLEAQLEANEIGQALPNNRIGWVLARVFHNKYALKAREYFSGYLIHYDLSYLFAKGNPEFKWYQVPGLGLLPHIALPLIFIGLIYAIKNFKKNIFIQFLFCWLLASAVPAALTIEIPNPIRHLSAFPVYSLLIILGISALESNLNKSKKLTSIIFIAIFCSAFFAYKQFFINREFHQLEYSTQGFKEMVNHIGKIQDNYEAVVLSGDPYIYFLLWGEKYGWTPEKIETIDRQWGSVSRLGKLVFLMPDSCPSRGKPKVLYICTGEKKNINAESVFKTYLNSGQVSYEAIEFKDPTNQLSINSPDYW